LFPPTPPPCRFSFSFNINQQNPEIEGDSFFAKTDQNFIRLQMSGFVASLLPD